MLSVYITYSRQLPPLGEFCLDDVPDGVTEFANYVTQFWPGKFVPAQARPLTPERLVYG
jgi:hypothetical protein